MLDFIVGEKLEYIKSLGWAKAYLDGSHDTRTFAKNLHSFIQDSRFCDQLRDHGFHEFDISRLKLISEGINNKFVVVEGADASGKTSTANILRKSIGASREFIPEGFWNRTKEENPADFYSRKTLEVGKYVLNALKKAHVVSARYAYSVPAFNYAYSRGQNSIPVPKGILEPDVIVYVEADPQKIDARIEERRNNGERIPKHEDDPGLRALMRERYEQLFKDDPRLVRVDTTESTVESTVKHIMLTLRNKGIKF